MVSWWFNDEKVHEGAVYSVGSAAPSNDGVYTCQAVNCIYGGMHYFRFTSDFFGFS